MTNLTITVQDRPAAEHLRGFGHKAGDSLLGLYIGVPLPERAFGEVPYEPDQILIFRQPLERMCGSAGELREQIRITLIHELAHYFGFDEEYLRELGLD